MPIQDELSGCTGFDWDDGNVSKNWINHRVAPSEGEEIFFNQPLLVQTDEKHSSIEKRYYALGVTDAGRRLFAAFTIRDRLIRIISARDMHRKERMAYAQAQENPEV